jgi:hypothetical protein
MRCDLDNAAAVKQNVLQVLWADFGELFGKRCANAFKCGSQKPFPV